MTLIKIYMQGFNDCPSGIWKSPIQASLSEMRAYNLGWNDYVIGDDVTSWDNQTEEEILERIKRPWKDERLPR